MSHSNPRVLLIHTVSERAAENGLFLKSIGTTAPLGAACLAATYKGEVAYLDLQDALPDSRAFEAVCRDTLVAVIVQGSEDWDEEYAQSFAATLESLAPGIGRHLVSELLPSPPSGWRALIKGTGREAIDELLRGNSLCGLVNSLETDLTRLVVPDCSDGISRFTYSAPVEKTGTGSTVSVFRPWLGLLDRSEIDNPFPGEEWLARFFSSLKAAGFSSFHFERPFSQASDFYQVRSAAKSARARFSTTFTDQHQWSGIRPWPASELFAAWFCSKMAGTEPLREVLTELRSLGIPTGMNLAEEELSRWIELEQPAQTDRVTFLRPGRWSCHSLKKAVMKHFLLRGVLFRELWRIKSATELVGFMKYSYSVFNTLL